jgi:hypothetical protein
VSDSQDDRQMMSRELHRRDREALIANYEAQLQELRADIASMQQRLVPRLRRKTRLIAKAKSMSARFRNYMGALKYKRERRVE